MDSTAPATAIEGAPRTRVAVVGAGGIARTSHLSALRAHADRTELVAVVDVDGERAQAAAREWAADPELGTSGVRPYTDVHAMLAAEQPGLVHVCTPPSTHRDAVVAALDAGAWAWCEKPAVLSLDELDDVRSHERPGGPFASFVAQHRFGSAGRRLRQLAASGELGRPLVAVCHTLWFRPPAYFEVPWRGRWATEGGGPTMGHGIHQVDLLLAVLGDWRSVTAVARTLDREVETEDVSAALVVMESGAVVSVVNSLLSPREESYLRFDFSDATVEVNHLYGYDNAAWRWTPAPHVADAEGGAARSAGWAPVDDVRSSHAAQLGDLLDAMAAGERPPVSGDDAARTLELVAALYASAASGREVRRGEVAGGPFAASMDGGGRVSAVLRPPPSALSAQSAPPDPLGSALSAESAQGEVAR